MMTEKEIISAALIMPAESRIAIIDHLIASLTEIEQDNTGALWAKEAEDRISAYDRGEINSAPGTQKYNERGQLMNYSQDKRIKLSDPFILGTSMTRRSQSKHESRRNRVFLKNPVSGTFI